MWGQIAAAVIGSKFAQRQASKQMAFQKEMSDTAHQREVADLRAAGLNPILSGTGGVGATTPSGAMTSFDPVSSALSVRRLNQELDNLKAQEDLYKKQADKIGEETKVIEKGVPAKIGGSQVGDLIDMLIKDNSAKSVKEKNIIKKRLKQIKDKKADWL
jgi:hypothetical protein